jgi:hypothetical protein
MPLKVMAIDPSKGKDAKKGDYSAIVWFGISVDEHGNEWVYVDADLVRRPVEQMVLDAAQRYSEFQPHAIGLEVNGFQELIGAPLRAALWQRGYSPTIELLHNMIKKEIRIRGLGGAFAQRMVRFKRNSPGATLLVKQLKDFPLGKHDDGPDALEMCSQLVGRLRTERPEPHIVGHLNDEFSLYDDGRTIQLVERPSLPRW